MANYNFNYNEEVDEVICHGELKKGVRAQIMGIGEPIVKDIPPFFKLDS